MIFNDGVRIIVNKEEYGWPEPLATICGNGYTYANHLKAPFKRKLIPSLFLTISICLKPCRVPNSRETESRRLGAVSVPAQLLLSKLCKEKVHVHVCKEADVAL